MSQAILNALIIGGVAMLGNIGAILLLAYRVGKLTGATETRIAHGENDRARIWTQIGVLLAKLDRHIERSHVS